MNSSMTRSNFPFPLPRSLILLRLLGNVQQHFLLFPRQNQCLLNWRRGVPLLLFFFFLIFQPRTRYQFFITGGFIWRRLTLNGLLRWPKRRRRRRESIRTRISRAGTYRAVYVRRRRRRRRSRRGDGQEVEFDGHPGGAVVSVCRVGGGGGPTDDNRSRGRQQTVLQVDDNGDDISVFSAEISRRHDCQRRFEFGRPKLKILRGEHIPVATTYKRRPANV